MLADAWAMQELAQGIVLLDDWKKLGSGSMGALFEGASIGVVKVSTELWSIDFFQVWSHH